MTPLEALRNALTEYILAYGSQQERRQALRHLPIKDRLELAHDLWWIRDEVLASQEEG